MRHWNILTRNCCTFLQSQELLYINLYVFLTQCTLSHLILGTYWFQWFIDENKMEVKVFSWCEILFIWYSEDPAVTTASDTTSAMVTTGQFLQCSVNYCCKRIWLQIVKYLLKAWITINKRREWPQSSMHVYTWSDLNRDNLFWWSKVNFVDRHCNKNQNTILNLQNKFSSLIWYWVLLKY